MENFKFMIGKDMCEVIKIDILSKGCHCKEFIYQAKKRAYQKYVEENWGEWNEELQRDLFDKFLTTVTDDIWIIKLNGKDIGFYNGQNLEDGSYEIGNICIDKDFQNKGIGTRVLLGMLEKHKGQTIHIQYFKSNPAGELYQKLGFKPNGETKFHYQMVKDSKKS